jgi:ubiquinone/menaquinone biosynthesis C-methylase UbiE
MLAVARDVCEERGISNVETCVMDAQHLDAPDEEFNAAISRFG